MARRSLKPQLNQIRSWVRQGRTDAWIAHQLEVSVRDIAGFKREHGLEQGESGNGESDAFGPGLSSEEPDLRAEDDALVAAALEAEQDVAEAEPEPDEQGGERPPRRRRGRRGGRGRGRGRPRRGVLEGTFDHGEEGYGLWLDPAVQDDPVYAEHWAGYRPVTVTVEPERIVITRAGEEGGSDRSEEDRPDEPDAAGEGG